MGIEDPSGPGFNGIAEVVLEVLVGKQLSMALTTTNKGSTPFTLGCALHSYFAVSDIGDISLEGLSGTYTDKTRNWAMLPTPAPYVFTSETDRIHLIPAALVSIVDKGHETHIRSDGHDSVVVWNPWEEGARQLPDLATDEFKRMLCVETALTQGFELKPGESHTLVQVVE